MKPKAQVFSAPVGNGGKSQTPKIQTPKNMENEDLVIGRGLFDFLWDLQFVIWNFRHCGGTWAANPKRSNTKKPGNQKQGLLIRKPRSRESIIGFRNSIRGGARRP
jgi:hypothetical protein